MDCPNGADANFRRAVVVPVPTGSEEMVACSLQTNRVGQSARAPLVDLHVIRSSGGSLDPLDLLWTKQSLKNMDLHQ